MGFGRFPPSSGQPFGRKTARDVEAADVHPPHRRDGATRRSSPIGSKPALGVNAHPHREMPASAAPKGSEDGAKHGAGAALPGEPHVAPGSEDDDARFAGLATPSALVAELAGDIRTALPGERGVDPGLDLSSPASAAAEDPDGELPLDEVDDIAVTIGRVVGNHASVLWGTL